MSEEYEYECDGLVPVIRRLWTTGKDSDHPEKPENMEIVRCVASKFGVSHDVAHNWILVAAKELAA